MISRVARFACVLFIAVTAASVGAELKIAVVNAQKAVFDTEEAQAGIQTIDNKLRPQREDLEQLRDTILALRDQLTKDAEIMSPEEQTDIQKNIEDQQLDFDYGLQRLNKQIGDEREKLLQDISPKFNAVLQDLIDLEGYDMVLNWNPQVTVYVNPKHDITRKVTEMMNNKTDDVTAEASSE